MFSRIETAELDWQCIDGIEVPISKQFGDVYFSKDNGLLETRHVFLNGNDLAERLSALQPFEYFCVGETGFGTGLNILALWQLWQQVRPDNHSHLHAISVEKYPLSQADLIRALQAWPELSEFSTQLIEQYPLAIPGCHRLNFAKQRFSIDLWLGDASDIFPIIPKTHTVNAWFLDGFAPSCNPELWQQQVLDHIVRLSDAGTTFASFSVAGVLKRGLSAHGIQISRPRGFKHKREMLKAIWPNHDSTAQTSPIQQQKIAIIGAGIAGLTTAWAFAERGHIVTLFDANGVISGGSGNPLALLNPKLSPIQQSHEHLMTSCWQYAMRHYAQFKAFRALTVEQFDLKQSGELQQLIDQYPREVLSAAINAEDTTIASQPMNVVLNIAGAVTPKILSEEILAHPNIQFIQAKISQLAEQEQQVAIYAEDSKCLMHADHVVVCAAKDSAALFQNYPPLKPIRGQVSWMTTSTKLPTHRAYSYGGYCTQLDVSQLILGASFHPNREDTAVTEDDHQHNLDLLRAIAPECAATLPEIRTWQGRASIRAQTADYLPLLGQLESHSRIYSFAGLGSKGYLFAPLCGEVLVAQILQQACPIPLSLYEKLQPQRLMKKIKAKKPYFSK
ncbi:FAD-dependent 5-carboxymethylaminomethyl-2-thiouridine(34) oxidoreductase MnmC [Acinetobacter sp. MD2(2019)]|uniref:FAD-dependent 5-carboxymethylaminomethyl-2-thiouridine(34) oxidoreductase MnmC n=1 Tax=Acinetobacter sp. MD2(2019) TaxID=2605273 RepID=UPI002D1EE8E0|nr:FAD-dependent 5-carboxymethylaminomethyl-2-thiouridine(34) oxidoreductase MnmC [Acinetobacter sp. MD2(2019)]MEB3754291.1 FAD-dependent 5-carboxymethylaminomethyl-2-thiouridine(34) oxidoreductase MnmC [Acinetobacter sp. MD2(2019)]